MHTPTPIIGINKGNQLYIQWGNQGGEYCVLPDEKYDDYEKHIKSIYSRFNNHEKLISAISTAIGLIAYIKDEDKKHAQEILQTALKSIETGE